MTIRYCVLLLVLLVAPAANADDAFWQREVAYLTLHAIDWRQTAEIAANPEYIETNPYLGEYPNIGEVNRYFLGTAVLHIIIASTLPPETAKAFQWITIGIQAGAVGHNASAGVEIRF